MRSELVISTYQKPDHLKLVLTTLIGQTRRPDGVCLADDGSDSRTAAVVKAFAESHPDLPIRHVWHDDQGFRKTTILNEAVRSSSADYMIFIDDDCLMHPRYIERHLSLGQRGRFLTGSLIRMDADLTRDLLARPRVDWTPQGRPPGWQPKSLSEALKSMPLAPGMMAVFDRLSPVRCSWAGCNASTFRDHIFAVNGFDASMSYGGEDKEFGARLINSGIKGRHLRYSAPLYHLEHGRGYVDADIMARNRAIILETRRTGKVRTTSGIDP